MQASRTSALERSPLAGLEHYVRVTRTDRRGYVEFQYAIGDPALYLEMILPAAAFAEFCARHRAVRLPALERVVAKVEEQHDDD